MASVAAINAVHAGISAVDAFVADQLGRRSAGSDHHEALALIASSPSSSRSAIGQHFQRLLDRKNEVEYQDREVTIADARELARHAHRLFDAVRAELAG